MLASQSQHLLYTTRITLCCNDRIAEMPLTLRSLLRQNVALVGLAALHLVLAGDLEALRRALIRLHFRHVPNLPAAYLRGAIIMIIVRASIIGADSILPMSVTTSANFIRTSL